MKSHLTEVGSVWLQTFVRNKQISISELAQVEAATVLRQLNVEGILTHIEFLDLFSQLEQDSLDFEMVSIGGDSFRDRVTNLVFNLPAGIRIRALDAIQLTSASIVVEAIRSLTPLPAFTFVSSDRQLMLASQTSGFTTENPEDHP